uniref:Uncharacterized protein n=1 Tax=Chenopodium quinoa TaxID=63459 RepID=A0A803MIX1_CHEQI
MFCFPDSLQSRMSPQSVVSVTEDCSDAQLKSIRKMGFRSLKNLKVTQLPLHLGLWLVQHFNAKTSSLCIPDCESLRITEQHVHEVFGFPLGGQDIKDATTDPSVLLYVDRFVIEEVRAQREIPILKGWTTNMLSTREKLEFFKGRIGSFGNSQPVAVSSGSNKPKM